MKIKKKDKEGKEKFEKEKKLNKITDNILDNIIEEKSEAQINLVEEQKSKNLKNN